MKIKKHKRIGALILAAVLIAAVGSGALYAHALFDEKDTVHINPDEIENSTLAIGTHLIHISALTQPLYDIAQKSAQDSGQSTMYYKSELAGGTWFDISSASSLKDITTDGTPVDKSVISALNFTYNTKSDKITYDLRTNAAVNIFDIMSPYDLGKLDELAPLKNQYDQMSKSSGSTEAANVKKLLETDVKDDFTNDCDAKLKALGDYNTVLAGNDGEKNEQDAVQKVMESVDADRRAHVFTAAQKLLDDYLNALGSSASPDATLLSAVSESDKNVQDSFIKYDGMHLSEGTTVYQSIHYKYASSLISDAQADNQQSCDTDTANLISLDNIMNDTIADKDAEMSLINSDLLPAATDRFSNSLKQGESAEYKAQSAANASSAALKNLTTANSSTISGCRNELELFISAYCSRSGNDAAQTFIDSRITLAKSWYDLVPNDSSFKSATKSIDDHMAFLAKKKQTLQAKSGGDELQKLQAQKKDLQNQKMSALDKNDLDTAAKLDKQIADIDNQISALEKEASDKLSAQQAKVSSLEKQLAAAQSAGNADLAKQLQNELGTAKADLSAAQENLPDGSLGNQLEALKEVALEIIDSDNPSPDDISHLNTDIDAFKDMTSMNPKLVFSDLTALYNEMATKGTLNSTTVFSDSMAKIEDAISKNTDAYNAATQSEKSAKELQQIASDFISGKTQGSENLLKSENSNTGNKGGGTPGNSSGVTLPNLSREDLLGKYGQEVYLLALQSYYDQTGSDDALSLIASASQDVLNTGNQTVYVHVKNSDAKYIPLSAIHAFSGMRYVSKDSDATGTLAQGANYFTFRLYSNSVAIGKDSSSVDTMAQSAAFQNGLHICEDYSYSKFGISCVYLTGTQYAVISTDKLSALSDELLGLFMA